MTAEGKEEGKPIARVDRPAALVNVGAPDWLEAYAEEDTSLANTEHLVLLSRMKRIQGQTKRELRDKHGVGALVIMPDDVVIAKGEEVRPFVPLYFFEDYTEQSDIDDKTGPFIRSQSFDATSDIAVKAKDPNQRRFKYNEGDNEYEGRYVHHLCFFSVIYDPTHESHGTVFVLTFEKGEFNAGQAFITKARGRRNQKIPLWAQVWGIKPVGRQWEHEWSGADVVPIDGLVHIEQDEAQAFLAMHEQIKSDHLAKKVRVTYEDEEREVQQADVDAAAELGL